MTYFDARVSKWLNLCSDSPDGQFSCGYVRDNIWIRILISTRLLVRSLDGELNKILNGQLAWVGVALKQICWQSNSVVSGWKESIYFQYHGGLNDESRCRWTFLARCMVRFIGIWMIYKYDRRPGRKVIGWKYEETTFLSVPISHQKKSGIPGDEGPGRMICFVIPHITFTQVVLI